MKKYIYTIVLLTVTIAGYSQTRWYRDADKDGYGNPYVVYIGSYPISGYVYNSSDLNDNDPCITNIPATTVLYYDNDGDGYGSVAVLCNTITPGKVTNNLDCNDADASINPNTVWYRDADGDGYGTAGSSTTGCIKPTGYVNNTSDLNDSNANITNISPQTFYRDADGDGYGNPTVNVYYSVIPTGYVTNNTDCNDNDTTLNPTTLWYRDADADGYGTSAISTTSCNQPTGYVRNSSDYNDGTTNITNIPPQTFYRDADGDGYGSTSVSVYYSVQPSGYVTNNSDCNDGDSSLNPNTPWFRDNDGDGYGTGGPIFSCSQPSGYGRYSGDCNDYDSSLSPATVWYRDADGDGYGTSSTTTASCTQPTGYVRNASDYNDTTANITNIAPSTFYRDADGDGYGSPTVTVYYSVKPAGYVTNNLDCADGDASLNPTTVWYRDADGDGYGTSSTTSASCTQPTGYVRNSSDYNDGTTNITNIAPSTFYRDADGDGYGSASVTVYYSVLPTGYVTNSSDCNDGDASLNPNTPWFRDNDGDGYGSGGAPVLSCTQPTGYVRNSSDYDDTTSNITNITPSTFYRDADGDGYGSPTVTVYYSVKPAGYVTNNLDCADGDATLNPTTIWYRDSDGDGYGTSATTTTSCTQPSGYVRNSSDYNDTTVNITNIAPQTFYRDADGDTYGSQTVSVYYSVKPTGYVTNNTDCNDGDATLNPTTVWYRDTDGDGYGTSATTTASCTQPIDYVRNSSDYDDTTVNITNIAPSTFYRDADGDTYGTASVTVYYSVKPVGYVTNNTDCNDGDASLNPTTVWYRDTDGDGYGTSATTTASCTQPAGYVRNSSDYDDTTVNITNIAPQTFYRDADGDTYGSQTVSVYYSAKPAGYETNNTDCNDGDASLNPTTVWYRDADGDGYGTSNTTTTSCTQPTGYVRNTSDYDDTTVNITNIAPQTFYRDADGDAYGSTTVSIYYSVKPTGYVTNNTDCNDSDASLNPATLWYRDADGDGYGTSATSTASCTQPTGYVRNSSDYNDTTVNITNIAPATFYRDADGDTYGSPTVTVFYSVKPTGYVTNNTDCNDSDATLNPTTVWYRDADGDGYGTSSTTTASCTQPTGYVRNSSDYNDTTVNITNIAPQTFYADADSDGFGNLNSTIYYSVMPSSGYVTNSLDCDDTKNNINPNTKWYADTDGDGLGDPASFVTQCTAPAGNYVRDNTDNCPLVSGTSSDCGGLANPSSDKNYIITRTYKQASTTSIASPTPAQATVGITYYDGLGRPIQQIANQQSNTGKDIVTHTEYDAYGRQTKDYLPFVGTNRNMTFDSSAQSNTLAFYNTVSYENTVNPFSQKVLEASPLNRVLKQSAPGNDWALGQGHEIKFDYQTNTASEVKFFKATTTWNATSGVFDTTLDNASGTIFYESNQLYKNLTFDENTTATPSETAGSTVEFKNKEGKVVLKRTYATTGSVESSMEKHDTYYVYDIYGNLTYVIPPMADMALTQAILDDLCYQYQYDARNRLVAKKLPGKQWEFMVYDKLDRVVATGPAFSPFSDVTASGWLITKYDTFNRVVYTGWLNSGATATTRATLQQAQNGATTINESKQNGNTIDTAPVNYSNNVVPTTFKLLSVNYYDTYEIPNVSGLATSVEGQTATTATKGLPTGSWIRVATTTAETKAETSYILYDAKFRPIRSYTTNYLGGYTCTDSKLDSFSGQLQYTLQKHKRTDADTELTIKDAFTYSAQDRLLTHTHQINGGTAQLLAENTYDELGKLTSKKVGNTSAAPLQKVDYTYNIRGWLTSINNDPTNNIVLSALENDLFGFKINYNRPVTGGVIGVKELYNGNISETYWRTTKDNILRKYGYKYDNLNRLNNAIYQKPGGNTYPTYEDYSEKNITYDKNGNIQNLYRNGDLANALPANVIDNLAYTYATNSNKLMSVVDNSNNTSGFNDYNKVGDDYSYDANGNLITDKNKKITAITYNHLNLPTKIVFGTTGSISYVYSASGQKVEKMVTQGTTITTTNYLNGYLYKNAVLQYFPTAEGYVEPNGSSFKYVFQYKDHLGNVRLSYTKNTTTNALDIIEENNYYPFGLRHAGYNTTIVGGVTEAQKVKFGSKEFQNELELNTYDFGFRQYMPDIGRMPNIDMLAELAYNMTPNRYCFNNPLIFIDPSGLWETTAGGYTTNKAEDIKRFMSYLGVENNVLNNNPSKEQMSSFVEGEMSAGGHGKLSDGSTLADEITIIGTKRKGEDFKNGYVDKSFQDFYHGVQRSLTPDALDPRTVRQQFFGLTYPGPWNPQTYAGDDDYSYIPTRPEEFPAITHDLAYDKLKIRGGGGLFTAKSAIPADYKFVTQELAIALSPAYSMRTRVTAGCLGLGLGFCASFKVQYFTVTDAFKETYQSIKK